MPKVPLSGKKKSLAAIIGSAAAAYLLAFVIQHEGLVTTTYKDVTGTPTVCVGETSPDKAIPGVTYTAEQCMHMLEDRLAEFAEGVRRITPGIMNVPELAVPAIDLAYNIGLGAYERSSAARRFNEGRYGEGCKAMTLYVYSKGRKLRGLELRREHEYEMCLQGAAKMKARSGARAGAPYD